MKRFQTKQIHLSTDSRKPEYHIDKSGLKSGYLTKLRDVMVFKTTCGKECLRKDVRMRTHEVTCKSCIATTHYKEQLAEDNKKR